MTSLMDQEYLAFLDMWIHLTLHPGWGKRDYLALPRPFTHPTHRNTCHACDVTRTRGVVNCGRCPLEFEGKCGDRSLWMQWAFAHNDYLSYVPTVELTDRVRHCASEILMTRWRRK